MVGLYGLAADDEEPEREFVQFVWMDEMSEVTVVLSERTWNVVFDVAEIKVACAMGPPGRLELLGSPYSSS